MGDFYEPTVRILIPSAAYVETEVGVSQGGFVGKEVVQLTLDVTAIAGIVTDTLDVVVYASPDHGDSWIPAAHFPQVVGTAVAPKKYIAELLPKWAAPAATCVDVSADPAANVVRAYLIATSLKATATIVVDAGRQEADPDASFTFAVTAIGR